MLRLLYTFEKFLEELQDIERPLRPGLHRPNLRRSIIRRQQECLDPHSSQLAKYYTQVRVEIE